LGCSGTAFLYTWDFFYHLFTSPSFTPFLFFFSTFPPLPLTFPPPFDFAGPTFPPLQMWSLTARLPRTFRIISFTLGWGFRFNFGLPPFFWSPLLRIMECGSRPVSSGFFLPCGACPFDVGPFLLPPPAIELKLAFLFGYLTFFFFRFHMVF